MKFKKIILSISLLLFSPSLLSLTPSIVISSVNYANELIGPFYEDDGLREVSLTYTYNSSDFVLEAYEKITIYRGEKVQGLIEYCHSTPLHTLRKGNKYSMPAFITVNTNAISVDEIVTEHVSVYPNPTSGILNVDINENFNAVIYNYQGQVVMKTYVNNGQIDMSQLASGIYFVEIRTNNSVSVEKVIVK
jgi:hypothetical protein